jgi:hypothetical protein
MKNKKSVVRIESKEPIIVRVGSLSREIRTESDGYGGSRYYFCHATKMNRKGTQVHKVHSQSVEIIKQRARDVLQDLMHQQPLTRKGFELFAQVVESGLAFHVPARPMTADEIIDGLLPIIANKSTKLYCQEFVLKCNPLRERLRGQAIHQVTPKNLEQLSIDIEEGQFLTDDQKRTILIRKQWTTPPLKASGRPKWYADKNLARFRQVWHRIFTRARALGAWPLHHPLPTDAMVKP